MRIQSRAIIDNDTSEKRSSQLALLYHAFIQSPKANDKGRESIVAFRHFIHRIQLINILFYNILVSKQT